MNIVNQTKNALRTIGQVKWFNIKSGYGFITADDNDIFVHYSNVLSNTSYKYLVLGENVEFELTKSVNESHVYQANAVTGLNGGKLMCEIRHKQNNEKTDDFTRVISKRSKKKENPV